MVMNNESIACSPGVSGAKVDAHHSADIFLPVVIVGIYTADYQQKQAQQSHVGINIRPDFNLLKDSCLKQT